jgi:hypothetical protein
MIKQDIAEVKSPESEILARVYAFILSWPESDQQKETTRTAGGDNGCADQITGECGSVSIIQRNASGGGTIESLDKPKT